MEGSEVQQVPYWCYLSSCDAPAVRQENLLGFPSVEFQLVLVASACTTSTCYHHCWPLKICANASARHGDPLLHEHNSKPCPSKAESPEHQSPGLCSSCPPWQHPCPVSIFVLLGLNVCSVTSSFPEISSMHYSLPSSFFLLFGIQNKTVVGSIDVSQHSF